MKTPLALFALLCGIGLADAPAFADDIMLPTPPGAHEVTVRVMDGDTYRFHAATGDITVDGHPVLLAQADTAPTDAGVAMPDVGSDAAATPAPAPTATPLSELADLKAKYAALRAATPDVKLLAWAALIAAALKVGLSLFNRYVYKQTKAWTKWVALAASVPIALLSYFALGHTLLESLIFAGAGPGAIIVHELLQKAPPKEPATA